MWDGLEFSMSEIRARQSAVILLLSTQELVLFGSGRYVSVTGRVIIGLWEWVDSLVVSRVILLSYGSNVPHLVSPCVQRSCPRA